MSAQSTKQEKAGGQGPAPRTPRPAWWRMLLPGRFREERPLVAVVRFSGAIGAVTPLRTGITLQACEGALRSAFSLRRARAVALAVNSPGGSPVQSAMIYRRIRALAEEKKVPVYAFAEDVAASGGYLLACAGDELYADKSSIVGSIGVISAGFGLDRFIERFGIERRVHTRGDSKDMLDPFQPEKKEDVRRLAAVQEDVYEAFKEIVRERRGRALEGGGDKLFTGEFWSGTRARELGLVDGIGDLHTVMRERFGEKVRLKEIKARRGWLLGRLGAAGPGDDVLSALEGRGGLAADLISALETRALWARFGL